MREVIDPIVKISTVIMARDQETEHHYFMIFRNVKKHLNTGIATVKLNKSLAGQYVVGAALAANG